MESSPIRRRELIAGLTLAAAALAAGTAQAAPAAPTASPAPGLAAVTTSTAECQRAGRVCLAHCTDFLADGMAAMADCQRAVMNMLAVTGAMADVAGYGNAAAPDIAALAASCARFCDTCAEACRPHATHHAECKACMDACVECAKACRALAT